MKKGNNSEKHEQLKKVENTILKYLHIDVNNKFQPPMPNDEVCKMATDKQTHKYTHKNIHTLLYCLFSFRMLVSKNLTSWVRNV